MSSYDFIVDNMKFSYSSLTTFENCPHCWKLTYIDSVKPKEDNFFSDYGLLIHECMEQFFRDNIDVFDLTDFYRDNFYKFVKSTPPPFPQGMEDKYYKQGEEFFDTFDFNKNNFNTILIEDKADFLLNGSEFTTRPDLVLQDRETGENILYDYKSSAPFRINKYTNKETIDNNKINGYKKQTFIYAHGLRVATEIPISKIRIWFTRPSRIYEIPWTIEAELEALDWAAGIIDKIKSEEEFIHNNSNNYFCSNLCSVRNFCEYK